MPPPNQDPITTAESKLRSSLDDLEVTGILQCKNRMDIEALLNPPEESWMMDATTDEEICQTVLATCNEQEGGGCDDIEDDIPVEPNPTYKEVIQALSTINKYAGGMDDPIARNVETVLASFAHRVRSRGLRD